MFRRCIGRWRSGRKLCNIIGVDFAGRNLKKLLSQFFTSLTKHKGRRTVGCLTGEPDLIDKTKRRIIDIKSSWSLDTFPATKEAAHDSGYEWQVRAYMMLWPDEVDSAEVAHCMVSTPDEFIGNEPDSLHIVDQINPMLRVTRCQYTRCTEKEALIRIKLESAQTYFDQVLDAIANDHA